MNISCFFLVKLRNIIMNAINALCQYTHYLYLHI